MEAKEWVCTPVNRSERRIELPETMQPPETRELIAWPRAPRILHILVPPFMLLSSVPFFLLAIVLVFTFSVLLPWFPPGGGFDPVSILRFDLPTALDIHPNGAASADRDHREVDRMRDAEVDPSAVLALGQQGLAPAISHESDLGGRDSNLAAQDAS